ncbi:Fic family protein [Glutamicibacter sp.]|uniref:Fic family protein n=1 Tax=Glutamicibacter sp. TaxID=1931995 RepID=UPI003D6B596D
MTKERLLLISINQVQNSFEIEMMLLGTSEAQSVSLEESQFLVHGLYLESLLDLEQLQAENFVREYQARLLQVRSGELSYREILTASYLYELHCSCFGQVFSWAGVVRTRPPGFVGVAPEQIRNSVLELMGTLRCQIEEVRTTSSTEIAMRAHHELVKIHPFVDGNGRTTRLFSDLLLASLSEPARVFNWRDTPEHIQLLRACDTSLDYSALVAHVGTRAIF